MSLFTSERFKEFLNPVLYLGVRDLSYNIYKSALIKAEMLNKSFKIKIVNQQDSGILNIKGILEENSIKKTFFISGPPIMIKEFKKYLFNNGVNDLNIITDDWE